MRWILHFDGLTEPRNPGGWMTWAYVLEWTDGEKGHDVGNRPPHKDNTNNVAEYFACGCGLKRVRELIDGGAKCDELLIRGDSKLVIEQLSRRWAVNKERLRELRDKCLVLLTGVNWKAEWIPRERNTEADDLTSLEYERAAKAKVPNRGKRFAAPSPP